MKLTATCMRDNGNMATGEANWVIIGRRSKFTTARTLKLDEATFVKANKKTVELLYKLKAAN